MSELFSFIKALLEKSSITLLLLSIAVGIISYKMVFVDDALWAICSVCISYVLFSWFSKLFDDYKSEKKRKEEEKRAIEAGNIRKQIEDAETQRKKEQKEANLRTIYASLPNDVKRGLERLYYLPIPDGGFTNARIIRMEQFEEYSDVIMACNQVMFNLGFEDLIAVRSSINSNIYSVLPDFYMIIEEKAKEKEK